MCSLVLFLFFSYWIYLGYTFINIYILLYTYTVDGNYHIFFSYVLVKPRIFIIFIRFYTRFLTPPNIWFRVLICGQMGKDEGVWIHHATSQRTLSICHVYAIIYKSYLPMRLHVSGKQTRGAYTRLHITIILQWWWISTYSHGSQIMCLCVF